MIKVDFDELKDMESDLKTFALRSFPIASRFTLNTTVFEVQKASKKTIKDKMVVRNQYTQSTIKFKPTKTLNVNHQEAEVGSTEPYMKIQEFGGIKPKKGKEGVPIPTSYAARQAENTQPRTRLVSRSNKMQQIKLRSKVGRAKNRKQELILNVKAAVQSGNRYLFYDSGKKKGIFKVVGGRKSTKSGWPKGAKLKMVYDLTEQAVSIPRTPWLQPSVNKVQSEIPEIYHKALEFQLKRQGLFK